jgi:3-hydroxyisobutyrate dehydrogenase-like beta-hydroxyacid dehydrogenase
MGTGLQKFAVIGFGEAGSILAEDLVAAGREVAMYDILLDSPSSRAQMRDRAQRARVRAADTFDAAVAGMQVVISAVTASSSADVAARAAGVLRSGQVLLDINSALESMLAARRLGAERECSSL